MCASCPLTCVPPPRTHLVLCARASSRPNLQLGVPLLGSRSLFLGARVEPSSRHSTAGVAVRGARFVLARAESSTCPRELPAEPPARCPTAEEPIVVRRCSRGAELLGLRPATLQGVHFETLVAGPVDFEALSMKKQEAWMLLLETFAKQKVMLPVGNSSSNPCEITA